VDVNLFSYSASRYIVLDVYNTRKKEIVVPSCFGKVFHASQHLQCQRLICDFSNAIAAFSRLRSISTALLFIHRNCSKQHTVYPLRPNESLRPYCHCRGETESLKRSRWRPFHSYRKMKQNHLTLPIRLSEKRPPSPVHIELCGIYVLMHAIIMLLLLSKPLFNRVVHV
jgi:hypothetical protein